MKKIRLASFVSAVVVALALVFFVVSNSYAATTTTDPQLWDKVKAAFIEAGWTPPVGMPAPQPTGLLADAWIYPDAPNIPQEIADGRTIYALKAEFFHVDDSGTLTQINQSASMPNGYSTSNASLYKQYSKEQYITVSGDQVGTALAMKDPGSITKMVNLTQTAGFTGIELDWEGFGQWTPAYYTEYKAYLTKLDSALAVNGKKLMIDGPAIWNATSQGYFQYKYEEISPLVDNVVMMVYDAQWDNGAGTSIQPSVWATQSMVWLKAKSKNGIVGVPSYGYKGTPGQYNITVGLSATMAQPSPTRNSDGELTKTVNNVFYDWSDKETMTTRVKRAQDAGVQHISIWSLGGGNPWF